MTHEATRDPEGTPEDDLPETGSPMPRPDPIWVALGIVIWAIALALGRTRRTRFIEALERLTEEHEARGRIVAFGAAASRKREVSQAIRVAARWLRRVVKELRGVK